MRCIGPADEPVRTKVQGCLEAPRPCCGGAACLHVDGDPASALTCIPTTISEDDTCKNFTYIFIFPSTCTPIRAIPFGRSAADAIRIALLPSVSLYKLQEACLDVQNRIHLPSDVTYHICLFFLFLRIPLGIARFLPCAANTILIDSSNGSGSEGEAEEGSAESATAASGEAEDADSRNTDDLFGGLSAVVQPSPTTFDCCEGTGCQPDPRNTFSPRCMPLDNSLTNPRQNAAGSGDGGCVIIGGSCVQPPFLSAKEDPFEGYAVDSMSFWSMLWGAYAETNARKKDPGPSDSYDGRVFCCDGAICGADATCQKAPEDTESSQGRVAGCSASTEAPPPPPPPVGCRTQSGRGNRWV